MVPSTLILNPCYCMWTKKKKDLIKQNINNIVSAVRLNLWIFLKYYHWSLWPHSPHSQWLALCLLPGPHCLIQDGFAARKVFLRIYILKLHSASSLCEECFLPASHSFSPSFIFSQNTTNHAIISTPLHPLTFVIYF